MSSPVTLRRLWELGSGPRSDSPDRRRRWGWRAPVNSFWPQVMLFQMVTGGWLFFIPSCRPVTSHFSEPP